MRPRSLIALALLFLLRRFVWPGYTSSPVPRRPLLRFLGTLVFAGFFALAFPLAQILSFGLTDYRRSANAIVVFGAGVYANGRMSPVLKTPTFG